MSTQTTVTIYGDAKGPFKARSQGGVDIPLPQEFSVIKDLYDHLRSMGYAIQFDIKASQRTTLKPVELPRRSNTGHGEHVIEIQRIRESWAFSERGA